MLKTHTVISTRTIIHEFPPPAPSLTKNSPSTELRVREWLSSCSPCKQFFTPISSLMSLDLLVNNRGERKYFGEITGPHTQFCTLSQISRQQALESNERKKEWDARGRHTPFFLTPTLCKQYSWTIIRFSEKLTDGEKTWKLQRRAGKWTNFVKKKGIHAVLSLLIMPARLRVRESKTCSQALSSTTVLKVSLRNSSTYFFMCSFH